MNTNLIVSTYTWTVPARCLHQTARDSHQRLLRESARHEHDLEGNLGRRRRVRGSWSHNRQTQVDRYSCWPYLRFELPTPGLGGSLRMWGLPGEIHAWLRSGVEQGDEPWPLRPRLVVAQASDNNITKVAHSEKEVCQLIKAGYEYICEMDHLKLFRKRK